MNGHSGKYYLVYLRCPGPGSAHGRIKFYGVTPTGDTMPLHVVSMSLIFYSGDRQWRYVGCAMNTVATGDYFSVFVKIQWSRTIRELATGVAHRPAGNVPLPVCRTMEMVHMNRFGTRFPPIF